MSKVVAIMSMSLDGYVADLNDGVAEVFNWYINSGDVEIHTGGSDPMTFKVSEPSAEHLRGLTDRKSTRLNSSHGYISYAVFCLKKKKKKSQKHPHTTKTVERAD